MKNTYNFNTLELNKPQVVAGIPRKIRRAVSAYAQWHERKYITAKTENKKELLIERVE